MARTAKDPEITRLEASAKRAKERLQEAKLYKKYGIPTRPSLRQLEAHKRREAKALPKEVKQAVLDLYHGNECKTFGELAERTGLTVNQVAFVLQINTEVIKYHQLRRETI